MKKFNKLIILFMTMVVVVMAYDPITQNSALVTKQTAHISPEILNELKDFKNLIPTGTVTDIVAKHYLFDKNFRIAFKYLRSREFTQLQQQLLNIPEIIDILEFLHLTTTNATTRHMGVTKSTISRVNALLDDYNADDVDDADTDNRVVKMTTNTFTIINSKPNTMAMENVKGALHNKRVHKIPQHFQMAKEKNKNARIDVDADDDDANSIERISNEQQKPLVHIVLLEDLEVNAKAHNEGHHNQHHYQHHHQKHHRKYNDNYHHYSSLGTFTRFVEEILQHLPRAAFKDMIKQKCTKNAKFAEFYNALRSPAFKPIVDKAMLSANIKKVIETLKHHNVDVKSLEPIAFKVISWGPNISKFYTNVVNILFMSIL